MKSRLVLRISKKCLTSLGYVAKCPCGVVPFKTAAASTVADHSVALPMQVRPVGISREDDQMRIEIQKTLTPFQKIEQSMVTRWKESNRTSFMQVAVRINKLLHEYWPPAERTSSSTGE